MSDIEARERIATLEAEMRHMVDKFDRMCSKVDDMHDLLMQAKMARYILVGSAAVAGSIAGFATKFIPFLSSFPK